MAKPIPADQREYMGPYLSDLPGIKIFVVCKPCGITKRFDGMALLDRIDEDCNLATLIDKIRQGLRCEVELKRKNYFDPQCKLVYDSKAMDDMNPGRKHRTGP